jgi:cell division transport system permease protein
MLYCLKQGMKNLIRNIWFSLASMATIAACIFLFCLLFSVMSNVRYMAHHIESEVGITVLFDEDMQEADILALGMQINQQPGVKELVYITPQEAWETFKADYFAGNEELAEGFAEDNPLADSASFEIFLENIDEQDSFVEYLRGLDGVRQVNYSNSAVEGFSTFNKVAGVLSAVIIGVLLAVSIFLISNTISTAAAFRRQEIQIMRLIGATNGMIRAPFLVEGVVIGLVGAVIPLCAMFVLYTRTVSYVMQEFRMMSDILTFMPMEEIFPMMVGVGLALGLGIGFFGSLFTIRKYMRV